MLFLFLFSFCHLGLSVQQERIGQLGRHISPHSLSAGRSSFSAIKDKAVDSAQGVLAITSVQVAIYVVPLGRGRGWANEEGDWQTGRLWAARPTTSAIVTWAWGQRPFGLIAEDKEFQGHGPGSSRGFFGLPSSLAIVANECRRRKEAAVAVQS